MNITVIGHYNQANLKREIREQFIFNRDPRDEEIHLIIADNGRLQTLFGKINIPGFFEKVKILELRNIHSLRDISSLEKFVNLKNFIYSGNYSEHTYDFPTNLNKLEHIKISKGININIRSFSHYPNLKTFINLKNYTSDDIEIPDDIGTLTNLTKLKILGNVSNFPIERLTNLQFLSIIGSKINIHESFFANKINKLPNLEELNINFRLAHFSEGDFPKLSKLKINARPFSYDFQNITNLTEISVGLEPKNSFLIYDIIVSLCKCLGLKKIDIREANLSKIPPEIGNLVNLEDLNLKSNEIKEVPTEIGNLIKLKYLNLSSNLISELPNSITNLVNLEEVTFVYNRELQILVDEIAGRPTKLNEKHFLQYFSSRCIKRTHLYRSFGTNTNVSLVIRHVNIKSKRRSDTTPQNTALGRWPPGNLTLFKRDEIPFIEQIKNLLAINGENFILPDFNIKYKDYNLYGLWDVVITGEPGIDAGGLYRQVLSDISTGLEEKYIPKFKSETNREGDTIINPDMEGSNEAEKLEELKFVIKMMILLFNTGEGNFSSPFTFGHCINLWESIHPGKNIMDSEIYWRTRDIKLYEVVIDFAINILEEPDEVKNLPITHPRLTNYLWLMNEFITGSMSMEESPMCLLVKTYNTTQMDKDSYDYIFTGTEIERPAEEGSGEAPNVREGAEMLLGLRQAQPEGNVAQPEGNVAQPEGNVAQPEGNVAQPEGNVEPAVVEPAPREPDEELPAYGDLALPQVPGLPRPGNNGGQPIDMTELDRRINQLRARRNSLGVLPPSQRERLDSLMSQFPLPPTAGQSAGDTPADLQQVPGYAQPGNNRGEPIDMTDVDRRLGALRARRLGSSPEMLPLAERIRQIQEELPLPPNVNPGDAPVPPDAPANQSNAPGPSWRDVPTGQVLRVLENAITSPIDEQELQDITDAATEAANEGYDPLQYHERHDNNAIITLLGDVPSYIPRFMDIYFTILGRDIMNETIISWLENADSRIKNGFLIMLHSEIETLNANPRNNAPANEANAPANEANAPANEANAPANEANAPANTQRVQPADLPREQSLRERIRQTPRRTEERNTYSIAVFPYIVRNMVERFGENWRQDDRAVTQFRNLVSREQARDNEAVIENFRASMPDAAGRFETRNPNWRDTLEGRRSLRRTVREQERSQRQRASRQGASRQGASRQGTQRGGSNNSNSEIDYYYDSQKSLYHLNIDIINIFSEILDHHNNEVSVFIDRKEEIGRIGLNIFTLYSILCPSIEINIDKLLSLINFSSELKPIEVESVQKIVRDFKTDLTQADVDELDEHIRQTMDKPDVSLDTVFPSQDKFLGDLLGYWTGSRKLSNDRIKMFFREDMPLLEAHTCFNELITGPLTSTKDFLKKFITSYLLGGNSFGIAGRTRTTQKRKKKKVSPQILKKVHKKKPSLKTMSTVIGKTKRLYNKHHKKIKRKKSKFNKKK